MVGEAVVVGRGWGLGGGVGGSPGLRGKGVEDEELGVEGGEVGR